MSVLMLLLPALGWGFLPLAIQIIGGNTKNQIFGTAMGTMVASMGVLVALHGVHISTADFIKAALAGAFWICGQIGQYVAYENIGASKTMPLSTGLQLIGTSLIGVLMFGEWSTTSAKTLGFIGIAMLVIGVFLTSYTQKGDKQGKNVKTTYTVLILTTVGYLIYNTIPRGMESSGLSIFFPESVGMLIGVLIYLFATRDLHAVVEKKSWENVISGLIFSVAAISYIFSVKENGVNTAFVVGQVSVVISTLGSLIFLHERKTRRELIFTILGLIVIVGGAIVTTIN